MCGIAGRILTAPGLVGNDLVELMDAQEHRGADSTGFAVYGTPLETGYILRGMGFDRMRMDTDLADVATVRQADVVPHTTAVARPVDAVTESNTAL